MGNRIITGKVKGITKYYAKTHMFEFHSWDFLKLVPEFDNPYDQNAIALYDNHNHKIGFIDRFLNVEVYEKIKGTDYVCVITSVFADYDTPSIEYQIIYRTPDSFCSISEEVFFQLLSAYKGNEEPQKERCYFSNEREIRDYFESRLISYKQKRLSSHDVEIGIIKEDGEVEYHLFPEEEVNNEMLYSFLREVDNNGVIGLVVFQDKVKDDNMTWAVLLLTKMDRAVEVTIGIDNKLEYKTMSFEDIENRFSPVTDYICYLQNSGYVLDLYKNYPKYLGLDDLGILTDFNVILDRWGEALMKIVTPEAIKKNFKIKAEQYNLFFLKNGTIMVCTPASTKYTSDDKMLSSYCQNIRDTGDTNLFIIPMKLKDKEYYYIVYPDMETINVFREMKQSLSREDLDTDMGMYVKKDLESIIGIMQGYKKILFKDFN